MVEVYRREGKQWHYLVLDSTEDILDIDCVHGRMTMTEIYEDVFAA